MASDIWLRTVLIVRKETRCRHIGSLIDQQQGFFYMHHPTDKMIPYHGLCYTSHGALAGTRNSSMGPPHEGSNWRPIALWANALHLSYVPLLPTDRITHTTAFVTPVVEHWLEREIAQWCTYRRNYCCTCLTRSSNLALGYELSIVGLWTPVARIQSVLLNQGTWSHQMFTARFRLPREFTWWYQLQFKKSAIFKLYFQFFLIC